MFIFLQAYVSIIPPFLPKVVLAHPQISNGNCSHRAYIWKLELLGILRIAGENPFTLQQLNFPHGFFCSSFTELENLRPIQSVDVIIAALTIPHVSLQAVAWLASWRKTVISLNGASMGVLHNCVTTKEKKNKRERSITPSTHTASKKKLLSRWTTTSKCRLLSPNFHP